MAKPGFSNSHSSFPSPCLGTRKNKSPEPEFAIDLKLFFLYSELLTQREFPRSQAPAWGRLPSREAGASPASAFPSRGLGTRKTQNPVPRTQYPEA